MTWKKKIKKLLPDKLVYSYNVIRTVPEYLKALKDKSQIPDIKFYSDEETVSLIVKERKSLSRFGDGEFMWMSGERISSFQDYSAEFARDLTLAFKNDNENLLVGIPHGVFDSSKCNLYAKMHWRIIRANFLSRLVKFMDVNRVYSDASITRPYIDYRDRNYSAKIFDLLKRIWDKRDVVIVEGEKTKLGMGNDLFDNATSIKRIICPAENAYSKLEAIKSSIRLNVEKDTLILGALGPTASILASQLCDEGYQFVDIGHVDVEYMWYLRHAILRETIEGKYVNESGVKTCSNVYDNDSTYINSIIDRVLS